MELVEDENFKDFGGRPSETDRVARGINSADDEDADLHRRHRESSRAVRDIAAGATRPS